MASELFEPSPAKAMSSPDDRLRALFAQAPGFTAILNGPEHRFEFTNAAYDRLVGGRARLGQTVAENLPEVVEQGFIDLLDGVFVTGEPFIGTSTPVRLVKQPGRDPELSYVDFIYSATRDDEGKITGVFVQGYDVTERVEGEQRRKLLADEMNHRVKNLLATVQSLAMLTGKSAKSVAEFRATLSGRIEAIAKTQNLLISGSTQKLSVAEVINNELAPYLGTEDCIRLSCEDLFVEGDAVVSLGLLVHELLTNAAKHGVLSDVGGELEVRCERRADGAVLVWREALSVPISAPAPQTGFGSLLIERLARDLGGGARLDLRPEGLEAVVIFDLSKPQ